MPPENNSLLIRLDQEDDLCFAFFEQGRHKRVVASIEADLLDIPAIEVAFKSFVFLVMRELVKHDTGVDIPDSEFKITDVGPMSSH